MKRTLLIALTLTSLIGCETVQKANEDFKNFKQTIVIYNFPKAFKPDKADYSDPNCPYCIKHQKCKWLKCPNK